MKIARPILTLDAARERRRAERSRLFSLICALLCIAGTATIFYHAGYDHGVADAVRATR